jgi:hypothetical protein
VLVALAAALAQACGPPPRPPPPRPPPSRPPPAKPKRGRSLDLPPRPSGADGAGAIAKRLAGLDGWRREDLLLGEILAGNVPPFLRQLRPIDLVTPRGRKPAAIGRIWVTSDYLAVGSDEDFLRVPLFPSSAQRVADRAGCLLPTRRIVDAVWRAAPTKLAPSTIAPGPDMISSERYFRHDARIEKQRREKGHRVGDLVAGHKKDIVVTPLLAERPGKLAIYGLIRPDGTAIQPLSSVHSAEYVDYSHGVRLVHRTMLVGVRERSVQEVLADPELSALLSDEGPILRPRYPVPVS